MIDMTLSPTPYTPTAGRAVLRFDAGGNLVVRKADGSDAPVSAANVIYGKQAASVASASTVNLTAATGEFIDITGTATISFFTGMTAGVVFILRFTGTGLIQHSGLLALPGAANITRAVGDVMTIRSIGSNQWVCTDYTKVNGGAVVASGGDFSSNTATSVDSEIVLFSGTAGKTGKRATGTGLARVASGVLSASEISGDATTSGSNALTIANNAVTYPKMQDFTATARILGRRTAGAGDPEECTLSQVLDFVGSAAQGDILYRGVSGWVRLAAGTNGFFLKTQGTGADPTWAAPASLTDGDKGDITVSGSGATWTIDNSAVSFAKMQNVSATARILGRRTAGAGVTEECTLSEILDFIGSAAQGDLLYRGASGWVRLPAGTSGQYLKTQGAGANPTWSAVAGLPVRIATKTSDTGNVGTGEGVLWSVTIPITVMLTDNQSSLAFDFAGVVANNANSKRVRLVFDTSPIFDSGAFTDGQNGRFRVSGFIIRVNSFTCRCLTEFAYNGSTVTNVVQTFNKSLAGNLSVNTFPLNLTGEAVSNDDLQITSGFVDALF